ncbi:CHRD domain-containing protein [Flaviaesturariibacter aridisoli]|uniref:CHRD domain-containing protein n=1 Tax=Flaviaesturariibacter aridisoli TaxID=2545761 RepID=A0A4R4E499_9BACT|nr:CHRD domain-containing protein [Flaviaesturariibacter aridisoli]TCZ74396.1 CHRD domain-containing protein [Flaviaesturariibacter aridisoli]
MFQRLTFTVLSVAALAAASCKKSQETVTYAGNNLPLTASQVVPVPASPSPATGNINASYDNTSRTLSYSVTWANTTDSVTSIRVYGPAEAGFQGALVQQFPFNTPAVGTPPRRKSGSFSQTLAVDNTVVKENELLAGLFYVQVFTKASTSVPELRGQILLQRSN